MGRIKRICQSACSQMNKDKILPFYVLINNYNINNFISLEETLPNRACMENYLFRLNHLPMY